MTLQLKAKGFLLLSGSSKLYTTSTIHKSHSKQQETTTEGKSCFGLSSCSSTTSIIHTSHSKWRAFQFKAGSGGNKNYQACSTLQPPTFSWCSPESLMISNIPGSYKSRITTTK